MNKTLNFPLSVCKIAVMCTVSNFALRNCSHYIKQGKHEGRPGVCCNIELISFEKYFWITSLMISRWSEFKLKLFRSGQVRSGQVRSGQVRSGQVMFGSEGWFSLALSYFILSYWRWALLNGIMVNVISYLLESDFLVPICCIFMFKRPINVIFWVLGSDMAWPKWIPLSGVCWLFYSRETD